MKEDTVADYSYEGFYARFETISKKEGTLLMSADNIVGDDFTVFFKTENGKVKAWLKNKFDAEIGFFDVDASRKLQLANARDQKIRAILALVAYSDTPEPGGYWGEMAVFCYNPAYETEFNAFIDRCASLISNGNRPEINLGSKAVRKIFDEKDWVPSDTVALPNKEDGYAVMKGRQSLNEKIVEQARAKNIGCYIVSWAFIFLIVIGIGFLLHAMGLF